MRVVVITWRLNGKLYREKRVTADPAGLLKHMASLASRDWPINHLEVTNDAKG